MPEKLEKCVADVKAQGKSDDSAWAICKSSTGETKEINDNRQVPFFNPPAKTDKVEPRVGRNNTKVSIGGTRNPMTTDKWKQIRDAQLKRNVKEPRY